MPQVPLGSVWNETCEHAFESIKHRLIMAPVLAYAEFTKHFVLVDTSHRGLGAVLSQEHDVKLRKRVEQWCQQCERCILSKAVQPKIRSFQGTIQPSLPHEILAIDFTILEPASDCHENILVFTDVFSKYYSGCGY